MERMSEKPELGPQRWPDLKPVGLIALSIAIVWSVSITAAGQPATPAMTLGSDLFRCVIAGSGQLGDRLSRRHFLLGDHQAHRARRERIADAGPGEQIERLPRLLHAAQPFPVVEEWCP